jgi:stalled ribosome rescue protein Dom34
MTAFPHAVVWIDHHEARIIFFNREESDEKIVKPANARHHLHSKSGTGARAPEDHAFYETVAKTVGEATKDFLVAGPANAKTEFVKHLHRHVPRLVEKLAGVETMAKVTDGELLAAARHYFHASIWKLPAQTA